MIKNIGLEIGIVQQNGAQQIGSIQLTKDSKPVSARFEGANAAKYAKYIRKITNELLEKFAHNGKDVTQLRSIKVDLPSQAAIFSTISGEIALSCNVELFIKLVKIFSIATFENPTQLN